MSCAPTSQVEANSRSGPNGGPNRAATKHAAGVISDRDGNREIYLAAADGADPVRLTVDPAADFQPNFAPDGSRIAFTSTRVGGLGRIFVVGADGSASAPEKP